MNATRLPSVPSTAAHRMIGSVLAVGAVAGVAALPAAARAAVFADVVSSTPVTAFVPVQRRDCSPGERRSADASTVDPNSQPVGDNAAASTRCRTVTVRTQRVVAYDVVYEIGGERQTVRLDRDPGARVELGVVAQTGRPVGRPVGQPVGRPVPAVDDGGPVEAAPTYGYGEQRPIGAAPQTTTTVIVERPYGGYGDGYPYGYGYGYGYPYAAAYGYPWFGPSIGIGFWGGGWWGHGSRHWHGGHRPSPPKNMFHHRGGGGANARR